MNPSPGPSHQRPPRIELRPALTARMAEQVRAWSGLPLLGLGCVIGYRAVAAGAVVSGLMLGAAVGGLGAVRVYHLFRYLRARNSG